jgi:hypothetical protein
LSDGVETLSITRPANEDDNIASTLTRGRVSIGSDVCLRRGCFELVDIAIRNSNIPRSLTIGSARSWREIFL